MVGTTFRRAGQAGLARFTVLAASEAEQRVSLQKLAVACGLQEVVYLATCNRVEWVFVTAPGHDVATCRRLIYQHLTPPDAETHTHLPQRAAQALHAYAGDGAAEHLFVVAASLDSMVVGEAQILGQVKAAYRQAAAWKLAGPKLAPVFEEAFAAAKRVRQDTRLGQGSVSMLSLALGAVEARLAEVAPPHALAVVGVGKMAHQCGAIWGGRTDRTLLFVNRTRSRAEALAARYGGQAMALDAFLQAPPPVAILITATASPTPLFDDAFFARWSRPPWAIDLAVLRDVVPEAVRRAGGTLLDIDRLKAMAQDGQRARAQQQAHARHIIDEMLEQFRRRRVQRELRDLTQALRAHFQATLQDSLDELPTGPLRRAPVELHADVRTWAQRLVNRLAHGPTVGLKHVGVVHGTDVVDTFLQALRRDAPDKGTPP
jgi:glutamyl-tRNA reductase